MRTYVDTHAHLDGLKQADPDDAVAGAVARAAEAGVTRIVAVGGNPEGNAAALRAARRFPGVRAAVGYDRYGAARADWDPRALEEPLSAPETVALGEIGLDFFHDAGAAPAQERLFASMLNLASDRRLPVVVHCREAEEAMLPHLARHAARWTGDPGRIGVIHCFTGSVDFARRVLDLGFFFSFSGILTFPRAENVREAARAIPPERLLVETDTPYLAPVPHRGLPNEPRHVGLVCDFLATVKGMEPDAMAAVTTANAIALFSLP